MEFTISALRAICEGATLDEAITINAFPLGKVDHEEIKKRGEACNVYVKSKMSTIRDMLQDLIARVEQKSGVEKSAISPMFKDETPKYPQWTVDKLVTTNPNFKTNPNTGYGNHGPKFLDIKSPAYYYNILQVDISKFNSKDYDKNMIESVFYSIGDGFGRVVQMNCGNDGINVVVGMSRNSSPTKGNIDLCITYNEAKKLLK